GDRRNRGTARRGTRHCARNDHGLCERDRFRPATVELLVPHLQLASSPTRFSSGTYHPAERNGRQIRKTPRLTGPTAGRWTHGRPASGPTAGAWPLAGMYREPTALPGG